MGRPGAQAGFSMLESLVAMLLIALWMLATAGVQLSTFKFQKSAGNRYLAVALAGELAELIDANRAGANAGGYALVATGTAIPIGIDCAAVACSPTELAAYDLAAWTARVQATLPLEQVSVTAGVGPGGLVSYTIDVSWNEPRGRQTYGTAGTTETLRYVLATVVRSAGA